MPLSKPILLFATLFASGNLLSRFARAILPNSVIYDGPSDEALAGQLYVGRDQIGRVMVDDILTQGGV